MKDNTKLKYSFKQEYSKSYVNQDAMIGVTICSSIPISKKNMIMFDNPHLAYKKDENKTYTMSDKYFITCYVEKLNLTIANGHGIPFFAFKKESLDFKEIYEKMETNLLKDLHNNDRFIVLGDMNYTNFENIYPKIYSLTNSNINEFTTVRSTGEKQQLDYIMTSKNINVTDSKTINNSFDHKLCLIEINID